MALQATCKLVDPSTTWVWTVQVHFDMTFFSKYTVGSPFSGLCIHDWESTDVEGQLYGFFFTSIRDLSVRGRGVCAVLESIPRRYRGTGVKSRGVRSYRCIVRTPSPQVVQGPLAAEVERHHQWRGGWSVGSGAIPDTVRARRLPRPRLSRGDDLFSGSQGAYVPDR